MDNCRRFSAPPAGSCHSTFGSAGHGAKPVSFEEYLSGTAGVVHELPTNYWDRQA